MTGTWTGGITGGRGAVGGGRGKSRACQLAQSHHTPGSGLADGARDAGSAGPKQEMKGTMKIARWTGLMAGAVLVGVLYSGCAWQIGGDKHGVMIQPTKGQELQDLKKAKDQGAMSEEEYQAQRTKVLER
jgi:Short C-terminal domain